MNKKMYYLLTALALSWVIHLPVANAQYQFDACAQTDAGNLLSIQPPLGNVSVDAAGTRYVNVFSQNSPQNDFTITGIPQDVELDCAIDTTISINPLGIIPDPGSPCTEIDDFFVIQESTGETLFEGDVFQFNPNSTGVYVETLTFFIEVNCGETVVETWTVSVAPGTPPVAVCDEMTQITLGPTGTAEVCAPVFDDGSTDDCAILALKVKRMDALTNEPFEDCVNFTCDDIDKDLFVRLRVYDKIGDFSENDPNAQYNECMVEVEIDDKISPVIDCPPNITVNLDPNACEGQVFYAPTALDNCGIVSKVSTPPSGTFFGIGTHVVTTTATDPSGNTSSCSFFITVNEYPNPNIVACKEEVSVGLSGDCFDPVIEITPDLVIEGGPYGCLDDYLLELFDLENNPISGTFIDSTYIGDTLIVQVTDPENGNFCTSLLIVTGDAGPPVFICPDDKTIGCQEFDETIWDGVNPTQQDPSDLPVYEEVNLNLVLIGYYPDNSTDCNINYLIVSQVIDLDACESGVVARTYTAYDDNDNSISCTQQITVENSSPFFICDVLPWNTPVTDCSGGHSLDDGVEWPADVTITACEYSPQALIDLPGFEPENAEPQVFEGPCSLVGVAYEDTEVAYNGDTIKVLRKWTIIEWCSLSSWEYTQILLVAQTDCNILNACAFTELGDPICNVEMVPDTFTDASGCVQFTPPSGVTVIAPGKDDSSDNGITIVDALGIRLHILDGLPLTPYQMIAADINGDNQISSFDLFYVLSILLGEIDEFPVGPWRFVDANYVFPDPTNPFTPAFPEVINYSTLNPSNVEFVGIKVGDINVSANIGCDSDSLIAPPSEYISLIGDDQLINKGETYTLDIHASNFNQVLAFELSLSYDPAILEFDTILSSDLAQYFPHVHEEYPGKLNIIWLSDDDLGTTLSVSEAFMNLRFKAIENGVISQSLFLSPDPSLGGIDSDQTPFAFDTLQWNGLITTGWKELFHKQIEISINPNPMTDYTDFIVNQTYNEPLQLTLFDLTGKTLLSQQFQNAFRLYKGELPAGSYYYQISNEEGWRSSGKLLILQ